MMLIYLPRFPIKGGKQSRENWLKANTHFLSRINSCPNNCSGHGKCTPGNSAASRVYCECDKYWKGEACDIPYCRNNCGSPDHGYCDLTGEKLCVCNDSWQGTVTSVQTQRVLTCRWRWNVLFPEWLTFIYGGVMICTACTAVYFTF